jgi:hypothetical protein
VSLVCFVILLPLMFDSSVVLTDGYDADEGAMMFNGEGKI